MHRGIAMAFGVALCSLLLDKRLAHYHLLLAHARLVAYQDCLLVIGIGFLVALLPAWWSRTRAPYTPQHLPVSQVESAQIDRIGEE